MAIDPKQIGQHQSDIDELKKRQKLTEWIMLGIVVVSFFALLTLVIALGTIVVDTFRSKEVSYDILVDKVEQQSYDLLLIRRWLGIK